MTSKVGDLAEDLGRMLGSAERRAASWLDQRQDVRTQLTAIRDKANTLLSQLGWGSPDAPTRRNGPGGGAVKGTPGRKKRVVPAESRKPMGVAKRRATKRRKA